MRADFESQAAPIEALLRGQGVDLDSPDGQARLTQARRRVLDGLIEQAIIEQAAAAQSITVSDAQWNAEVQKTINDAGGQTPFELSLAQNDLTFSDFRRTVRINLLEAQLRDKVIPPPPARGEQVHVRHILFGDKAQADSALAQLKAGADFATLAKQYSLDSSSRTQGGDLGWLPHGLTALEFEKAAFALSKNQLSGVVSSPFGFHLIQLIERDANRPLTADMQLAVRENAFAQWLDVLKSKAQVERFAE